MAETPSSRSGGDRRGKLLGRPGRRLFGLLAALLATLLSSGLGPASAASAPHARTATNEGAAATVALTEVSPRVPEEGDTLTLRGTVTNEGETAILNSSVAARQGVLLESRAALDESMALTEFSLDTDGPIVQGHSQDIGTVRPGMSRTFSLQVPVSALSLGADGVYQVGVTLTGQTEDGRWDRILGIDRSLLPWTPSGSTEGAGTRLTFLWPLVSRTHLTAQTGADEEQTPAFRDGSLLEEISPGGRLHRMVTLGADLPVTWVIDPDLLASVDAMVEEYQVYEGDELVAGDGQQEARAWLGALQDAVRNDEVVALPSGDPDLASLAHQGREVQGALRQLATATETAAVTVDTVLRVEPTTDFAWPVEGAIDPSIVSVATSAGAHHVIARSDSLRDDGLAHTPSAARPIGDGNTAVVADATLSTLFTEDMSSTSNAAMAGQQLLAQTFAIARQQSDTERNLLLAPQRMPTGDQAQAMADAIRALQEDADWISFDNLSATAAAEPDPAANQRVPSADEYPSRLRQQELPTSAFQTMRETQRTLDDFAVILTRPDRVESPFGNAIRREMSTSWRGHESGAAAYRFAVQNGLEDLTGRVSIIQKSPITLSGRSATIPVTVENNLVQDIQGLELRLTSSRRLGLEVSETQQIAVGGGHSQTVKFSTTARANGRTFLEARLFTTEDQKAYGEPMRFQASVTSYTPRVLMVIAGGLLLVVLAGIRMYTQRKRAAREGEASEDDAPAGESDSDTNDGDAGTPPRGERLDPDE
ncbi:hypothetical protein FH609_021275 [Streptomyces sp. 3MP-14]|uniref:Uncharacterized protein n=1 Tax=Streptomyces mimosae TaxID=2586635 RepID=A0A5N6A3I0_9ACTN|nr:MULTISPECIES: DUF6049 family protein [Streptomyces]KAB8163334.1 hypothetical protein FH607_018690 [Streptomyces mimosae]KAB8174611.1 hypothetical protein FH609_021275 [Streptomyces sp. 3MP-14]